MALIVLTPGPLLTVQDLGRPAARRYGVPQGGAMDRFALQAANILVGNPPGAAGLEITAGGAAISFQRPALIAVAGADLGATIDGRPLPLWSAVSISPGAQLRWGGRSNAWGARAYLAVAGGIAVPEVLGSRSTDLGGGFGGLGGRALRAGDTLAVRLKAKGRRQTAKRAGPQSATAPDMRHYRLHPIDEQEPEPARLPLVGHHWPPEARPPYGACPTLRVIAGPHLDCFAPGALAELAGDTFQISATSNRMGYRMEGPRLRYAAPASLPSLGVVPGAIQVPPDGDPILLMADAQTTGGYPVIGAVIGADLPLAAQLLPGDQLRFRIVMPDEAHNALRMQAAALAAGGEPDEGMALAALAGG